ncbi:MAG: hypothetical protein GC139_02510 [Sideroxydans sp.]|nr:hypothetical protein [Sideroxydans sp.]
MKKRGSRRIPVTHGLKNIYAMDMHLPYKAACAGKFTVVSFGRLAAAIMVIRSALERAQTRTPQAVETMDAAIGTLQVVRARGDRTGVWEITEDERPSVLSGIEMAEQCIGTLSVALLEQTADILLQQVLNEPAA